MSEDSDKLADEIVTLYLQRRQLKTNHGLRLPVPDTLLLRNDLECTRLRHLHRRTPRRGTGGSPCRRPFSETIFPGGSLSTYHKSQIRPYVMQRTRSVGIDY